MLTLRIWDLPTRVFHWLFALSFSLAFITHGSDRFLDIHVFAGYVLLGLLLFRWVWGIVGSRHARFRSFCFSGAETLGYLKSLLKRQPKHYAGHNPAGAWAIFLLLVLGAFTALSGILVLGIEEGHGLLAAWFNPAAAQVWKTWHEGLAFFMLLTIAIHLLGVIVSSLLHRENLARAMLTGYKQAHDTALAVPAHGKVSLLRGLVFIGFASWFFHGYALDANYRPFIGKPLASNTTWLNECGACHVAYHPQLLPARSWQALLTQQNQHFGEDLALDEDTLSELHQFHLAHAAETLQTEAAYKILASIPTADTPLRISATRYWQHKHAEINEAMWHTTAVKSRANCDACHLDAKDGWFEDAAMRLPPL